MCGIVGYVGTRRAAPILYRALGKLEYRGYDSAGICTLAEKFYLEKRAGSVSGLRVEGLKGTCGIGHTRWATHGAPTAENAHPHLYGRFAVVHNGILENYRALAAELRAEGDGFSSETDSEVVAHLLEHAYRGDLLAALRAVCGRLKGSYALAVLCTEHPGTIALARSKSPLTVAVGKGELLCASDIPALAGKGTLFTLGEGEYALLSDEVRFFDADGEPIGKEGFTAEEESASQKHGYAHFMAKEMEEIPAVLARCRPNFADGRLSELRRLLAEAKFIHFVGCGTAYHAALGGKYAFEALARVPCEVTVASEFRYRDPVMPEGTVTVAVSQSGETADTIAAAELAASRGSKVVSVVNERHSTLASISDHALFTHAGREVAVAATKSFNAQLAAIYSLAATVAEARGRRGYGDLLAALGTLAEGTMSEGKAVQSWAAYFAAASSVYFIGRGADYISALEGSLKFKEITYLPSEGYPAGELKHGTLALVEEGTPVVAVLTSSRLADKTMSAIHEVAARGAKVFLVTTLPAFREDPAICRSVVLPACGEIFSPVLSVIPLQQLAYYVALARGLDPDRPRNLAKSVTVE